MVHHQLPVGPFLIYLSGIAQNGAGKNGHAGVITGLLRGDNVDIQLPPKGLSVLSHGEDFNHVVGVIAHLCLAKPGNTEVTFAVNICKIF